VFQGIEVSNYWPWRRKADANKAVWDKALKIQGKGLPTPL
jgi:hypothetical protein